MSPELTLLVGALRERPEEDPTLNLLAIADRLEEEGDDRAEKTRQALADACTLTFRDERLTPHHKVVEVGVGGRPGGKVIILGSRGQVELPTGVAQQPQSLARSGLRGDFLQVRLLSGGGPRVGVSVNLLNAREGGEVLSLQGSLGPSAAREKVLGLFPDVTPLQAPADPAPPPG